MSFKAYIDNIRTKTGLSPEDFVRLAGEKGLLGPDVKTGRILEWLAEDYGLGRGHGMAIVVVLKSATAPPVAPGERMAEHFIGRKARWQQPYEDLVARVREFGPDVSVGPGGTYLSLLRKGGKFAIVQVTDERLDIGLKLNGTVADDRLEPAESWNSMVTHRLRVTDPAQLDEALVGELKQAYELRG